MFFDRDCYEPEVITGQVEALGLLLGKKKNIETYYKINVAEEDATTEWCSDRGSTWLSRIVAGGAVTHNLRQ